MPSAGKKAAPTRKRRAAAKKAVTTRKRRAAGRKAATTRKRRAAAKKAVATKRRREVAKKAAATRAAQNGRKAKAESPPKAGAKAKPRASEAKPIGTRSREQATGEPASRLIDQRIRDLGGWRGETLARMRALILEADPEMTEEWKWSTPVWSHHGIICTGEAYTKVVKLTFAQGASLPDPSRLFNSSLEGNTRRAIDIHEGTQVDAGAFKALVKAAVSSRSA